MCREIRNGAEVGELRKQRIITDFELDYDTLELSVASYTHWDMIPTNLCAVMKCYKKDKLVHTVTEVLVAKANVRGIDAVLRSVQTYGEFAIKLPKPKEKVVIIIDNPGAYFYLSKQIVATTYTQREWILRARYGWKKLGVPVIVKLGDRSFHKEMLEKIKHQYDDEYQIKPVSWEGVGILYNEFAKKQNAIRENIWTS